MLRGIGKTTHASVAGIIAYWLISLPMEYFWAFKLEYGLMGLWYGQTFGSVTHASILLYLVWFHFDWVQLSKEATE